MWVYYQNNPCGRVVGDCAVRAVAIALGISWEESYDLLANAGRNMCDIMNADAVWGAVLRMHGFERKAVRSDCPDCYTAEDFAYDHPRGIYTLGFGNHAATIIDGLLYDSWDSSQQLPVFYWTNQKGD